MIFKLHRNTLIAASVAAALGIGVSACDRTPDYTTPSSTSQAPGDATDADVDQPLDTTSDMTVAGVQEAGSDTWITTKVKSMLLADSEAKGLDVEVETEQGVVTLRGMLASQEAIDHVKAIAAGVDGVKRVDGSGLTVDQRG